MRTFIEWCLVVASVVGVVVVSFVVEFPFSWIIAAPLGYTAGKLGSELVAKG